MGNHCQVKQRSQNKHNQSILFEPGHSQVLKTLKEGRPLFEKTVTDKRWRWFQIGTGFT